MPHSSTHEVTIRRGNIASTWVPWRLASWKKIHCRGRKRQATPCSQRPWRSMLRNRRIVVATQLQRNCNGSLSRGASAAYPAHHSAAPPLLHWQVAGGRNTAARRAVHAVVLGYFVVQYKIANVPYSSTIGHTYSYEDTREVRKGADMFCK